MLLVIFFNINFSVCVWCVLCVCVCCIFLFSSNIYCLSINRINICQMQNNYTLKTYIEYNSEIISFLFGLFICSKTNKSFKLHNMRNMIQFLLCFHYNYFFKLYYSHEDDKFLCRKKKMNKILWSYSWYSWWWWWWLLKLWKTKIKNSIWNINSNEKKSCCFCLKYLKNWKKMKFDFLRLVIIIYFALNLNFLTQMAWTFET